MSVLCQPATSICPNTTAINPPCAKISAAEAAEHLPAHRYLRKQHMLREEDKYCHCWDVVGDKFLEGRAVCQSRHRAGTALKGLWVTDAHQSRDTVEGLHPTVTPRWGGGTQVKARSNRHYSSLLHCPSLHQRD